MKKKYLGIILSLLFIGNLIACSNNNNNEDIVSEEDNIGIEEVNDDAYEIDERIFIMEVRYITNHPDEYLGKAIKLQGYYYKEENDEEISYIVRNIEGEDNTNKVGFEFTYDGEMPKENDWIEVVGVLEECEHNHESEEEHSHNHVRLKLESLKVMDTRGQDTVNM